MGIRQALSLASIASGNPPGSNVTQIRSPWTVGQLSTIVLTDIFGSADLPVSRAEAMSVPSVAKARHLICGLSRQPLETYRGAEKIDDPTWVYRTDSQTPPTTRLLWTLDDLVMSGWSLWALQRGQAQQVTDAVRVPPERWEFDAEGQVLVDNEPVTDSSSVCLFSGPFEGLLTAGAATVRAAKNLERAWAKRVRTPVPITELHQTSEDTLTGQEVSDLLDEWGEMIDSGGGVAFTPWNVEAKYPGGSGSSDLLIDARNAVTLDVGRLLSVAGALLDASLSTASLTYTTTEGTRDRFLDETASFWLTPIEARLSMDDMCPRGQRMAFNTSELLTVPPTGQSPVRLD